MTERILVIDNQRGDNCPSTIVGTDLDTGQEESFRYWATHRGKDGPVYNPACNMQAGKCYRIGLRHSSRAGYQPEWMIREAEEIPPQSPPKVPTRDEFILAETCLKEAGECLRCDMTVHGGLLDPKAHLEYTKTLFQGTMKMLAENATEKR